MKNDKLKKNLFWILSGVGLFLTFLVFILVFTMVGGDISAKSAVIEKELTALKAAKAKGTAGIETMGKQKLVIDEQKKLLWKANWEQQLALFPWPVDPQGLLKEFERKYQKFGEPMTVQNAEFEVFKQKNVYEEAYEKLAKSVAPTRFAGGSWRTVLRHVGDWGDPRPTPTQIWLALEDLWVQTAVLQPVTAMNAAASAFAPAKADGETDFKKKFRSRVWEVDLEVPKAGPEADKLVRVKLTNRTDRMQLFGLGKVLQLNVWLSDQGPPVPVRIEGEMLKAREVYDVPPVAALHGIPAGTDIKKIARVELVLDARTVPVQRIDAVELSKSDARHAAAALKAPTQGVFAAVAAEATAAPPATGGDGAPGGGGPDKRMGGMSGMAGASGSAGYGGAGAGGGAGKAGTPASTLDANLSRYIDTTDQVRRMPVAVVLLVDQMYLQDALAAYSNSTLRFQITQYHWTRFRGPLDMPVVPGAAGGTGTGGAGGGSEGDTVPLGSMSGGGLGSGKGSRMSGMSGPPGGLGSGYGSGGPGAGSGGSYGGVSEAQAASGLVELTIYGIVTLYEKFDDGTTPAGTAATPTTPAAPVPATPNP